MRSLGFLPGRHTNRGVIYNILEQFEITTGRKGFPCACHDNCADIRIVIDVALDICELGVSCGVNRIVGLLPIECEPKNPLGGIILMQLGVGSVAARHWSILFCHYGLHMRYSEKANIERACLFNIICERGRGGTDL